MDISAHFKKHSKKYQHVVKNTNKELYKNIEHELNGELTGTVLDIGNGNIFNYDIDKLDRVIAIDLTFEDNMPDTGRIKRIHGDARDLRMLDSKSCDRVVMQFLLHHIVEKTKKDTDGAVLSALKEAYRVLKPEGKMVIIEMLVHPFMERTENILYRLNYELLNFINKPMIKFYSENGLREKLLSADFTQINVKRIDMGKSIDPFEAILPGVITIPAYLNPTKCYFIVAARQNP